MDCHDLQIFFAQSNAGTIYSAHLFLPILWNSCQYLGQKHFLHDVYKWTWNLNNNNNIIDCLTVYSIVKILCTNFKVGKSMDNCELITEVVVLVLYSIK